MLSSTFLVAILTAGNSFGQKDEFKILDSLSQERNLLAYHLALQDMDTTYFINFHKAKYLYHKGSLAFFEDDNESAVQHLLKSKKVLLKKKENLYFLFWLNDRLLNCVSSIAEYSTQPKEIIEENCEIANSLNDVELIYNCNHYKFADALDRNDYRLSLEIVSKLKTFVHENKLEDYYGSVANNLGSVYQKLSNWDKAYKNYNEAESYFLEQKDSLKIAYLYNNLGNYYKLKGEYSKALTFIDKALSIPIKQEAASTKKVFLKNKADILYFKGDFEDAALFYERYALLSDSLDRSSYAQSVSYHNKKYQTAEKDKQILQQENDLLIEQEQKLKNQNIAIALGGGLLGVSIIGFLLFKNTKRKQRIAEQEREIEIQKTEKLLKDQELTTIDAMISGQEKERQRLAGDLHDSVGATLAAAKLQFSHLEQHKSDIGEMDELFSKTGDLLDQAYNEIRSMAHLKNSGVIAKNGLLPAIKKLAKNVSCTNSLKVQVEDFGLDGRLENSLEIAIFRVIQELITNVIKHANASEASIAITQHEDSLSIIVEDNGKGFDTARIQKKEGMGLSSIERRIEHLEGTMEVDSTIGKGTSVLIDIPI